jgi:hypothetical protein
MSIGFKEVQDTNPLINHDRTQTSMLSHTIVQFNRIYIFFNIYDINMCNVMKCIVITYILYIIYIYIYIWFLKTYHVLDKLIKKRARNGGR